MAERFPWPRVMHLGLGVLRLPPTQFWHSTLKEIVAAFGLPEPSMERRTLLQMMNKWPDGKKTDAN